MDIVHTGSQSKDAVGITHSTIIRSYLKPGPPGGTGSHTCRGGRLISESDGCAEEPRAGVGVGGDTVGERESDRGLYMSAR